MATFSPITSTVGRYISIFFTSALINPSVSPLSWSELSSSRLPWPPAVSYLPVVHFALSQSGAVPGLIVTVQTLSDLPGFPLPLVSPKILPVIFSFSSAHLAALSPPSSSLPPALWPFFSPWYSFLLQSLCICSSQSTWDSAPPPQIGLSLEMFCHNTQDFSFPAPIRLRLDHHYLFG